MSRAETVTMKCSHCGQLFRGNPRSQPVGSDNYCSIGCEEGTNPLPMDDPSSPDYHLHLKAEPESLVGKSVIVNGLKFVDYSPDWCKGPNDWSPETVVDVNEEEEWLVRKDDMFLGTVVGYDGHYTIESEDRETGEITTHRVKDMLMVEQIRNDLWWIEG